MSDTDKLSRKSVLQGLVVLPALGALWAAGAAPAKAGKGSKAQFKYQQRQPVFQVQPLHARLERDGQRIL